MAGRLFVVNDDLMFAQRVLTAGRRLGVPAELISPANARHLGWAIGDVVVVQATLRPQQQLGLIDDILQKIPQPIVVGVTGHLETELRRQLRAKRVRLAAHSAMDRVIARALGLSDDDARGASQPHR